MKSRIVFLFAVLCVWCSPASTSARDDSVKAATLDKSELDLVLTLDNSGSMRLNDPDLRMRSLVSDFLDQLPRESRVGLLIFSDMAELVVPLTPIGIDSNREVFEKSMRRIDYRGKYTNIPAAIERAMYELSRNGRPHAQRAIVFMTDGIIDLGDRVTNLEKQRWLKDDLADACKRSGIRIFGVAFTDHADFELIQALAQKTDGNYFRALRANDISAVFADVLEKLKQSPPVPGIVAQPPVIVPPTKEPETSSHERMLWLITALLFAIGASVIWFGAKLHRKPADQQDISIPQGELWDSNDPPLGDKRIYTVTKKNVWIGRAATKGIDICLPRETISNPHASIRFKDDDFYLVDEKSTNGTFVNGERIETNKGTKLKSGDEISFDRYKFRFLIPSRGEFGQTIPHVDDELLDKTMKRSE